MHAAERSEGGGGAERRLRQCSAVFGADAAEGRADEAAWQR